MDAVKFIEERNRMCKNFGKGCNDCPADKNTCCDPFEWKEELVTIVEAWSAAHPLVNRQMSFLSHYPNADIDDDGVLKVCPKVVEGKNYVKPETCGSVPCSLCRLAYWSVIER